MSVSNHDTKVAQDLIVFLREKGLTDNGIAGVLGNLDKESALRLNNLQNSGNTKFGITDEEYTAQIDNGTRNFLDSQGYGICQWTTNSRKQNLWNWAKGQMVSIASEQAQFNCLWSELSSPYKSTLKVLCDPTKSIDDCARYFMIHFEAPANQSEANQQKRVDNAYAFFDLYLKEKKMSLREKVVEAAKSCVGIMENPMNSNKVIFNQHYYGTNKSAPWCCTFVWDMFREAGASEAFYHGKKTASCTTSMKDDVSRTPGLVTKSDLTMIKPGDRVYFQTKKDSTNAQHIGIVIDVDVANKVVTTIEGNTSATEKGSQDNGGIVAVKKRTFTNKTMWIYKLTHVVYPDEPPMNPYKEPTVTLYKGCPKGDDVRWLQWELNRNGYVCEIDGSFGKTTDKLVRDFQTANPPLVVDGRVGGKTRAALKGGK